MDSFLSNHQSTSTEYTNTRIGSTPHNVYGGKYNIPENKRDEFFKIYYKHVFEQGHSEYLTETQLDVGPIGIDIDFRYKKPERAYKSNDILEFVDLAVQQLNNVFTITQNFPIYVFEKPEINMIAPDKIKDGIQKETVKDQERTEKLNLLTDEII